jgi:hypothetical protein
MTAEHELLVELGKRLKMDPALWQCRLCGLEIEDEYHVLFRCTYSDSINTLREDLFTAIRNIAPTLLPYPRAGRPYNRADSIHLLSRWLRSHDILPVLARTIYLILKEFEEYEWSL